MASDYLTILSFLVLIVTKMLDSSRYFVGPVKRKFAVE